MEPGNDNGTECQKTRETIPGTLPGTRKWRWNRMPEDYRETIPGTLPGTRKWRWNRMPEDYRETIPRTLPGNKRNQEMMIQQNARIPGTRKSWWNKTVSCKNWEPHSAPELFGEQVPEPQPEPRTDDGIERQKSRETSPEPQPEPGNDDGTGCQKSRKTSPATLAGTRKWWWNRMPKE